MADRPKGNLFLELFIVVLLAFLLITILYPKKVWEEEAEVELICQARMEAIESLEYQYMASQNTYSTVVDSLLDINDNPNAIAAVDSTVNWDKLIPAADLEALILAQALPQDLDALIKNKLTSHQSLGNLMRWDSLNYQLIDALEAELAQLGEETTALDSSVNWHTVISENAFWGIFEAGIDMPTSRKNQVRKAIRQGTTVLETRAWPYMQDTLRTLLAEKIALAETEGVWVREEKDAWEAQARAAWEAEMDALPDADKDSLWAENESDFWGKEKEQLWAVERKNLWKAEGNAWKTANEDVWGRKFEQKWKIERKKSWTVEFKDGKPDSVAAQADSLWKVVVDSLQETELADWMDENRKEIEADLQGIWERERKPVWEEEKFKEWAEDKKTNFDAYWSDIKEGIWIGSVRQSLWTAEEDKLAKKLSALGALDKSIDWYAILGDQAVRIVDGLTLPDAAGLLELVVNHDAGKGSAIYYWGVADLFRTKLLAEVGVCPVAGISYFMEVEDTTTIKKFSIACPIIDEDVEKKVFGLRAPFVLYYKGDKFQRLGVRFPFVKVVEGKQAFIRKVNAETGEEEMKPLIPESTEKIFGGAKIVHHGSIDKEGKKSWSKKGGG